MPDTPPRAVRLSEADWSALVEIAERHGLLYGGTPSRNAAMVWLIHREQESAVPARPAAVARRR